MSSPHEEPPAGQESATKALELASGQNSQPAGAGAPPDLPQDILDKIGKEVGETFQFALDNEVAPLIAKMIAKELAKQKPATAATPRGPTLSGIGAIGSIPLNERLDKVAADVEGMMKRAVDDS
jgi:hypothetical protein